MLLNSTGAAKRLADFKVRLDNSSDPNQHNHICAEYPGAMAVSAVVTLSCSRPTLARYVSIINGKSGRTSYDRFGLCEVVVMGYKAIGAYLNIRYLSFVLLMFLHHA